MTWRIWQAYIFPWLLRRGTFQKRARIKRWLGQTSSSINICPINLGFSSGGPGANQIKLDAYYYLTACKKDPVNWSDKKTYFDQTATILHLKNFRDFDQYSRTVSRKSRGNDNRAVKKALRLEYRTRLIDAEMFQASIDGIRRSKLFRTGGLMLDALRQRPGFADGAEKPVSPPDCDTHWSMCWGGFHRDRLVAYVMLTRCGSFIRTRDIMGHGDVLRDGVMKLLLFDIVKWLYQDPSPFLRGIDDFMYGAAEHGGDGLFEWKLRLGFEPALIGSSTFQGENLPPDFDAATYRDLNPDVKKAGVDARLHYMTSGVFEGRRYR